VATKWQRIRIDLPKTYDSTERLAIGQEIIDQIQKRTEQGKDKKGIPFIEYSEAYKNSLNFKIGGKSKSKVNLRLSGDMMAALKIINEAPGSVTVGFENGTEDNGKADGNIRGTYGSPSPKKGKARDFLGIQPSEKTKILNRFPLRDRERSKLKAEEIVSVGDAAKAFIDATSEE